MLKNIDESKLTPGFIQPVKKIVDSRVDKDGIRYFHVVWKDTWEPELNLLSCQKLLEEFWDHSKEANQKDDLKERIEPKVNHQTVQCNLLPKKKPSRKTKGVNTCFLRQDQGIQCTFLSPKKQEKVVKPTKRNKSTSTSVKTRAHTTQTTNAISSASPNSTNKDINDKALRSTKRSILHTQEPTKSQESQTSTESINEKTHNSMHLFSKNDRTITTEQCERFTQHEPSTRVISVQCSPLVHDTEIQTYHCLCSRGVQVNMFDVNYCDSCRSSSINSSMKKSPDKFKKPSFIADSNKSLHSQNGNSIQNNMQFVPKQLNFSPVKRANEEKYNQVYLLTSGSPTKKPKISPQNSPSANPTLLQPISLNKLDGQNVYFINKETLQNSLHKEPDQVSPIQGVILSNGEYSQDANPVKYGIPIEGAAIENGSNLLFPQVKVTASTLSSLSKEGTKINNEVPTPVVTSINDNFISKYWEPANGK